MDIVSGPCELLVTTAQGRRSLYVTYMAVKAKVSTLNIIYRMMPDGRIILPTSSSNV